MSVSSDLAQFTGTEQYYKNTIGPLLNTDGVQFMASKYQAFWLIDAIASYQPVKGEGMDDFQLWQLKVKDSRAILTCRPDSDQPAVITQKIPYTDFPESITFYVKNGVLLLTTEH